MYIYFDPGVPCISSRDSVFTSIGDNLQLESNGSLQVNSSARMGRGCSFFLKFLGGESNGAGR